MKILLIEDDRGIALALSQALAQTHVMVIASQGLEGIRLARREQFDVIVLDLNLPDMNGLEVCEEIRTLGVSTPILVLSGEAQVMSKIRLLDAGANDYLTKPFSLGELKARLRVLQRQHQAVELQAKQLRVDGLEIDTKKHTVMRDNLPIVLRRKEFLLLECLMRHPGAVVNRKALAEYAWPDSDTPWANTIDVHIKYLRDKVDRPFSQPLIHTIHGIGYKIEAPLISAEKICE
jgi:two-component system OmpR family response regulator